VVTLARALIDAARKESRLDVVRAFIADAVQRRLCSPQALAEELKDLRLGGTHLPRRVLDEVSDGVRSAAEAWSRSLIRRSSLPEPEWNVLIRSTAGKQLAVVDGWWGDVGLAWQIDSLEFHLSPDDYARTMAQHSALLANGVMTVHTVPSRLRSDPAGVLNELRGAYQAAAQRPRPGVSATLWRQFEPRGELSYARNVRWDPAWDTASGGIRGSGCQRGWAVAWWRGAGPPCRPSG
jgi:hypothetical protein